MATRLHVRVPPAHGDPTHGDPGVTTLPISAHPTPQMHHVLQMLIANGTSMEVIASPNATHPTSLNLHVARFRDVSGLQAGATTIMRLAHAPIPLTGTTRQTAMMIQNANGKVMVTVIL